MPRLGSERPLIDPGLPAAVNSEKFEPLVKIFQRYDTALENKLFRAMHEVERLRRMRQGERLPAPVAVDVSVHTDPRGLDSFAECADKALESCLSEPPDKRENINSKTAPAESEAATSLDLNVEADARGLPWPRLPPRPVRKRQNQNSGNSEKPARA